MSTKEVEMESGDDEMHVRTCEMRISARATRNARNHAQRVIAMVYCIMLLAIALAITLYCTGSKTPELENCFMWFFFSLYATSVITMIAILVYFVVKRNSSVEAIQNGKLTARNVLFSMRGEPVSLYLRMGLCAFAVMGIVYAVVRAIVIIRNQGLMTRTVLYAAIHVLFFIVQPIFLLRFHRIVILAHVRLFSFVLLHLLTVNLCVWIEAALEKITHIMEHLENASRTDGHEQSSSLTEVTAYCLPAVPEHCAIAVAVIFEMTQRIGQLKHVELHPEILKIEKGIKTPSKLIYFLVAALIFLLVSAATVTIGVLGTKIQPIHYMTYLVELTFFPLLGLILCVYGLGKVNKMKFSLNYAKNRLDDKLLLLTFVLTVNCTVVSLLLCCTYLTWDPGNALLIVRLISIIIDLVQATLQTYYLHDMFYRCCHHKELQRLKPASGVIIVLGVTNFCLWMIYSFQAVNNDILLKSSWENVGKERLHVMRIFIALMHPMVMLFRYHSSVCFAISYVRIYEDEVARYESMLRWIKQGTTREFLQMHQGLIQNAWVKLSQIDRIPYNTQSSSGLKRCASLPMLRGTRPSEVTSSCGPFATRNAGFKMIKSTRTAKLQFNRQDTQTNLELACIRIAASEIGPKISKLRLKQQRQIKLKQLNIGQSEMLNEIDGTEGRLVTRRMVQRDMELTGIVI